MMQLKEHIHNMVKSMAKPGPFFLVFHDNHQDLKYLRSPDIDAPLDGLSFFLPESCEEAQTSDTPKIYVVDTSELFAALEGDSGGQKRSLERVCRLLQIKSTFTEHLHNAGNDARVTLPSLTNFFFPRRAETKRQCTHLVLKEMAGGDPLDMQRVARWPRHASNGGALRVQFSKEDEDSDALPSDDDDEELITAGPYDPKTGRLREGWAERVAKLRKRLEGLNGDEDEDTDRADGQPTEESVPNQ
jgi:hypothetical protein